uniref:NADH-plastoquinone oxidoreductase subunit 4 n=1 Tax=Trompettia cardenasiana TaxID=362354 RepID=A0A142BLQ7_9SOLA|nr:NADH-plastoquinone oxidoreductase subunit 4 [Trompettia cardenasiana]AMP19627.1 NADH-plastoquinone oxidoreductase subunit 4 [Trompettia cardenasiana]
MCSKIKIF